MLPLQQLFLNCGMDVTCVKLENLIITFFPKISTCVIRRCNYWNEIEIYNTVNSLIRLLHVIQMGVHLNRMSVTVIDTYETEREDYILNI